MSPLDANQIAIRWHLKVGPEFDASQGIGLFHSWIQKRRLAELAIDVADYRHVGRGPGIVLICHGAQYALDFVDGQWGFSYRRNRDSSQGVLKDRLLAARDKWLIASCFLEADLGCSLRQDQVWISLGGRLHAVNTLEHFQAVEPDLQLFARSLWGHEHIHVATFGHPSEPLAAALSSTAKGGDPNIWSLTRRLGIL